jgi:hypothetical protein
MAGLGSVAAWPVVARAQQSRVRRIGVLIGLEENDSLENARIFAFRQTLADWTDGGKVQALGLIYCGPTRSSNEKTGIHLSGKRAEASLQRQRWCPRRASNSQTDHSGWVSRGIPGRGQQPPFAAINPLSGIVAIR